jgi:hypothetical protein
MKKKIPMRSKLAIARKERRQRLPHFGLRVGGLVYVVRFSKFKEFLGGRQTQCIVDHSSRRVILDRGYRKVMVEVAKRIRQEVRFGKSRSSKQRRAA